MPHPAFDSNEHVCQNEYILSIPPTGISRSQQRANGTKCQQMSGNVRLIVGVPPSTKGWQPAGKRPLCPPCPQPATSRNDRPNLTIMSKMQQNATGCNNFQRIPALPRPRQTPRHPHNSPLSPPLCRLSAPLRPNGEFRQYVDEPVDLLFEGEVGDRDP